MKKAFSTLLLASLLTTTLTACSIGNRVGEHGADVDNFAGNIHVNNNNNAGTLNTTNGNITIGQYAITKAVEVTNGNINIDEYSQASSLQSTNGNVATGTNVKISGHVQTTNGSITIDKASQVGKDVVTSTGDIFIAQGSVINGDIIFEELGYFLSSFEQDMPKLTVKKNVKIVGDIHLYRPVELIIDSSISANKIIRHYELSD